MKLLRLSLVLAAFFFASTSLTAQSDPTFNAIAVNTVDSNPLGYWEYLPGAYYDNPTQDFPILFFFHGNGEKGNGSTDLNKVLGNGPPEILNTPTHILHDYFDQQGVIVISPQVNNTSWSDLRNFLNYIYDHYRIDRRRIYMTGLSGGAGGIHAFMNEDSNAEEVAGVVAVAQVGGIYYGDGTAAFGNGGAHAGAVVPWLASTAYGDSFSGVNGAAPNVDRIMGVRLGGDSATQTDCMDNYPGNNGDADYSATYVEGSGWTWVSGRTAPGDQNPRITLFQGTSHNSWDRTYNNQDVYDWLFAQVKPLATITAPTDGQSFAQGETITFSATAVDKDSNTIAGSAIHWYSRMDGYLGAGASLDVSTLRPGRHTIRCVPIDSYGRGGFHEFEVEVRYVSGAYTDAFTLYVDCGPRDTNSTVKETTPGWNNYTEMKPGELVLDNMIDSNDTPVGVRMELLTSFSGTNENAMTPYELYPDTAQRDGFKLDDLYGPAVIRLSGFNPGQTYDLKFFASNTSTSNPRETQYTVNGTTVPLAASENTNQTADFIGISPDAAGEFLLTVARKDGDPHWVDAYLYTIEISTQGASSPSNDTDADGLDDTWENTHFGGLSEGATGDFDSDGISNFVEFAMGSSPADKNGHQAPAASVETVSTDDYLSLTYAKDLDAESLLDFVVEHATDPAGPWSTGNTVEVSDTDTGSGNVHHIKVRCVDSLQTSPRQFLRLRLVQKP